MSAVNNCTLIGRLTAEPEPKNSANDRVWCRVRIAVSRRKDETDFFGVVLFGQPAEFLTAYGHKGDMISVSGELQQNNYTNKEGIEVSSVELVANAVSIVHKNTSNSSNERAADKPAQPSRAPQQANRQRRPSSPVPAQKSNTDDDDSEDSFDFD